MCIIHDNIDIGKICGRWEVISLSESKKYFDKSKGRDVDHRFWVCRCACGVERSVSEMSLKSGKSSSCGCLNREISREKNTKHGESMNRAKTPEYSAWSAMRGRCERPGDKRFSMYGGRGIKVCQRWQDFSNFLEDMGRKPSPCHSIERIDNNKGYYPGNCRWETPHEQMTNRTVTHHILIDGESVPVATLAKIYNIPANTLRFRIVKGWDILDALETPVRYKAQHR